MHTYQSNGSFSGIFALLRSYVHLPSGPDQYITQSHTDAPAVFPNQLSSGYDCYAEYLYLVHVQ